MQEKRIKQCSLSVKDIDGKQGIVQFYASSFGTKDSDSDIIEKGAFKKTISENLRRIKHLYNHEKTIGVIQSIVEDTKGLLVTSQLAKDSEGNFTTAAKDALIEYEAGVITEHSIGFKTIKEDYDSEKQANVIKEIKLWEVSSLDKWGANENTPVMGMKSEKDYIETLKKINNTLRNSEISDESAKQLLKYSRQINKFLKSLEANKKPQSTSLMPEPIDYNFLTNNL